MGKKFWLESLKGRDHSEDLGVDGNEILKCISGKQIWRMWIGLIWPRIAKGGGSCEHGNGHSDSIQCGEFDYLNVQLASKEGLCSMELLQISANRGFLIYLNN
jgi:hypothetical protein